MKTDRLAWLQVDRISMGDLADTDLADADLADTDARGFLSQMD
nr:hypothetical protein [Rhodopirellula sp.]